jgi:hypothetical protein
LGKPIDIALESGRFDIAMALKASSEQLRDYGGICIKRSTNDLIWLEALRSLSTVIRQKHEFNEEEAIDLVKADAQIY